MRKKLLWIALFCIITGLFIFLYFYKVAFADNVNNSSKQKYQTLLIPTGANFDDVLYILKSNKVLKNSNTFIRVAKALKYDTHVKPGRYLLSNNAGNFTIVRKLRAGAQDPVKIVFNNIQNKEQLAENIAKQIEASKSDLLKEFNNPVLLDSMNLTEDNFPTIFLANTYEFYWNTSAKKFVERMLKEYNKFWTDRRKDKAQELGLSPTEATILASIVQKESNHYDEYPEIAGVYINRLHQNWPLQADPTVMYALNKLGIRRRVYYADLKIQSPYNTYINKGLPPGPICLPERKSIEETLDANDSKYMYFCAKEDFSGYHVFAETLEQHEENAKRYQQALNEKKVK